MSPALGIRALMSTKRYSLIAVGSVVLAASALALQLRWRRAEKAAAIEALENLYGVNINLKHRDDSRLAGYFTSVLCSALDEKYVRDGEVVTNRSATLNDDATAHLLKLPKVRWLFINDASQVSDVGYSKIGQLTDLRRLTISRGTLSEKALAVIGQLTQLEELDLMRSHLSRSGVKHLTTLTSLKELRLPGSWRSPEVHSILSEALPECHIAYYVVVSFP